MPKFSDQIVRRFAELEVQLNAIRDYSVDHGVIGAPSHFVDTTEFYAWSSSALTAIQGAFGNTSSYYTQFIGSLEPQKSSVVFSTLKKARGVFSGAKADVDGGYLFDLQRSVSGEIFGDFVEAAKSALTEDHLPVAAVLACAALEDTLKRFATSKELSVEGKEMAEVINLLKSKSLVSGAMSTLLSGMPRIRNRALHADWSSLTIVDVRAVISCVEQFLLANF